MVVLLNSDLSFGSIYKSGIIEFKDQYPINPDGSRAYINRKKNRAIRSIYANKRQVLPNVMVDYDSIVIEPVYFKTPHGVTAFVNVISWTEVKEEISIKWEFPQKAVVKSNYELPYEVMFKDFAKIESLSISEEQREELFRFKERVNALNDKINSICDDLNSYARSILAVPFKKMGECPVLIDMSGESRYGKQDFYTSSKKVSSITFYDLNGEVVILGPQNIVEVKNSLLVNYTTAELSCFVSDIKAEIYTDALISVKISGMSIKMHLNSNPLCIFKDLTKVDLNGNEYWVYNKKGHTANLVDVFSEQYSITEQV